MDELKKRLLAIAYLRSVGAILSWDREVVMPPGGGDLRAQSEAHLAAIAHREFTSSEFAGCMTELKGELDRGALAGDDLITVRETWRDFERARKLPSEFVEELVRTAAVAEQVWVEARKASDFNLVAPHYEKIVALKRKEAEFLGYADSPYDALLDGYEPHMKAADVARILGELKDFLVPFIGRIKESAVYGESSESLKGVFPKEKVVTLNRRVSELLGFDFERGRIDSSAHPFSTGFHPADVRITTRYRADDLFYSLSATIHETGHALYEQGLPVERFGTPLAEAVSLGIHESQSRLFENCVGRSRAFLGHLHPILALEFPEPFASLSFEDFYRAVNRVSPSLIRTEADEVTYNLHIIVRFELEKALVEGTLGIQDLPEAWREKTRQYLGIEVPNDREGVLQDVHWSAGLFGYFPTYTLGNLYA
ncbi:MAG: carboxypeptidase M32, partial [Candidatus Colwellbacteria bacterium]|nr:carboxypeptidase M32 [Candidatus Colwellbacteria bacterium]